jgi:hypothetical protein
MPTGTADSGNVGMGQGARAAPKEIVALLRREIVKAIALPGMKERMAITRLRAGRQYARRVCGAIWDRNREMGRGHSGGGH